LSKKAFKLTMLQKWSICPYGCFLLPCP
jgi:hypothetical protein